MDAIEVAVIAGRMPRPVLPVGARRVEKTVLLSAEGALYQACGEPQCGHSTDVETAAANANPHSHT